MLQRGGVWTPAAAALATRPYVQLAPSWVTMARKVTDVGSRSAPGHGRRHEARQGTGHRSRRRAAADPRQRTRTPREDREVRGVRGDRDAEGARRGTSRPMRL